MVVWIIHLENSPFSLREKVRMRESNSNCLLYPLTLTLSLGERGLTIEKQTENKS